MKYKIINSVPCCCGQTANRIRGSNMWAWKCWQCGRVSAWQITTTMAVQGWTIGLDFARPCIIVWKEWAA